MAALLALLSAGLGGSADFVGGYVSKRLPAPAVVWLSQCVGLGFVIAIVLVLGGGTVDRSYLFWAIGVGQALLLGLVAFYTALANGKMGVVAPIAALGVVLPVMWALVVGHERLSLGQCVGIGLAILGIVLASGPELEGGAGMRPLLLAIAAGAGFGVMTICLSEGSAEEPLMTTLVARTSLLLSLTIFLFASRRFTLSAMGWASAPIVVLLGLLDVGALLAAAYAMSIGLVSVVSVLCSLYPVATVVLARLVLKERAKPVQMVGVVSVMAGVVLLGAG
ncbi:MAG: DMT family transporter [Nocardioidaceae bacterium]|nr:MAG: DMT family transporter [Nocardioidaceae bacterium]